jgi:hypothetical protein
MARSLVINADDFGYSPAINAAIAHNYAAGGLTSTSLLVNGTAAREAYRLARTLPGLGVGWHVNLTEGGPVLPPREVPSLVDRRGRFRPIGVQLRGILSGTARTDELARELAAQLALLLDAGIVPTHVDGHLHAHAFPRVLPLVLDLMVRHRIGALRSPHLGVWLTPGAAGEFENPWAGLRPDTALARLVGARGVASNLRRLAPHLDRPRAAALTHWGIVAADQLYDAAHFLGAADPPIALAAALGAGDGTVMEIMTHPAWNRDPERGAAESALLNDPCLHAALLARGIRRVHYGTVRAEAALSTDTMIEE